MDELLNSVEKIKKKLSSKEYKRIMDNLGKVNELTKKVVFEVYFAKIVYNIDCATVHIQPRIKNITLTQPKFEYLYDANDILFPTTFGCLMSRLTNENKKIVKDIAFGNFIEEEDDDSTNIYIDYNHDSTVYIRFLEGKMEEKQGE
jgi:hypothetical protein